MKIFENTNISTFYCFHCHRITEHHHRYAMQDAEHTIALRKCKTCGLDAGEEVLHFLTCIQKNIWRTQVEDRKIGLYDS